MLCLRRISLDAKSRLLFLSRSHSSTNDSMPKSTAISRLIHKKFLQQNGNNSPQAIFVFFQQRSLRTKAHALVQPVLKEKYKSAKDKYQKDKSELRGVRTKVFEDTDKSAEFKYGFGPSGTKPKDEWEKGLYRNLKKSFEKSGKSEEEFEQALKQINLDMIERFYMLITGVIVVFLIVVAFGTNLLVKLKNYFVVHLAQFDKSKFQTTMNVVRSLHLGCSLFGRCLYGFRNLPASIVLFTVLQALSHFGVRAYFRMTCGRKEKPKPSTALPEYDMKSGTK
ncbi:hypothetical protein Ddc_16372 [Ditylenchus destructor]|nr:hypothetical protein Ddc_16372 [Ditylenchus destructor]